MKSPTGTQTSSPWMIRIGWVLTGLSSANMIGDSLGKILPWHPVLLLEEVQRLGESEIPLILLGILEFAVGVVYLIPRTSILGAILMTGFLGGAEAIQIRVSGSGAFLIMTVVLATIATVLFSFDAQWLGAVPIIGQLTLSVKLLGGEHPTTYRYLITAVGSILPALAFVATAARLLRRESFVFRS